MISLKCNQKTRQKRPKQDFPAVQCLRFCAPNSGGVSLIPGWGTKIPHSASCDLKKEKNGPKQPFQHSENRSKAHNYLKNAHASASGKKKGSLWHRGPSQFLPCPWIHVGQWRCSVRTEQAVGTKSTSATVEGARSIWSTHTSRKKWRWSEMIIIWANIQDCSYLFLMSYPL